MNRPEVVKQIWQDKNQERQLFQSRTQTKFYNKQQQRLQERTSSQENFSRQMNLYQYITNQNAFPPTNSKQRISQKQLPSMPPIRQYEKQLSSNNVMMSQNVFFGGANNSNNGGSNSNINNNYNNFKEHNPRDKVKSSLYQNSSNYSSEMQNQSCGTYDSSSAVPPLLPQTGYAKFSRVKISQNEQDALQPSEYREKIFTQKFLFSNSTNNNCNSNNVQAAGGGGKTMKTLGNMENGNKIILEQINKPSAKILAEQQQSCKNINNNSKGKQQKVMGLDRLFTQQLQKRSTLQMQKEKQLQESQKIQQQQQQQQTLDQQQHSEEQYIYLQQQQQQQQELQQTQNQIHKLMRTAESFFNKAQQQQLKQQEQQQQYNSQLRPGTKASQCSTNEPPESRAQRMSTAATPQYTNYVRKIEIEPEEDVDFDFRKFHVKLPETKKYNLNFNNNNNNFNINSSLSNNNNNNNINSSIQTGFEFPQTQLTNATSCSVVIHDPNKIRRSINITKLADSLSFNSNNNQQIISNKQLDLKMASINKSNGTFPLTTTQQDLKNSQKIINNNFKNQTYKKNGSIYNSQTEISTPQTPMSSDQFQNNSEMVNPSQLYLVVRNEYFDNCTSKNSLKYCYFELPPRQSLIRELEAKQEFQRILNTLSEKLKFTAQKLFLFLKDGSIISQHYEIPPIHTTLILSASPLFKGLQSFKKNSTRLKKILLDLEYPVLSLRNQLQQQQKSSQQQISNQPKNNNNSIENINIKSNCQIDEETMMQGQQKLQFSSQDAGNNELNTKQNVMPQIMTFEKRISKKFQPIINAIITTLNEDEVEGNLDSATLEQINNHFKHSKSQFNNQQQLLQNHQKQLSIIEQQFEDEINNNNSTNKQKSQENIHQSQLSVDLSSQKNASQIQSQSSKPLKMPQNWEYDTPDDYLQSQEILIKNKRIQDLEMIDQYYNEELQNVKFHKIEVQDEENDKNQEKIQKKILNKDKNEEPTPIEIIAKELGIVKQQMQTQAQIKVPKYLKEDPQANKGDSALNSKRTSGNNTRRQSFLENKTDSQESLQMSEDQNEQNLENNKKKLEFLRQQSKKKIMDLISEIMKDFLQDGKYRIQTIGGKKLATNVAADMLKSEEDLKEDQDDEDIKSKQNYKSQESNNKEIQQKQTQQNDKIEDDQLQQTDNINNVLNTMGTEQLDQQQEKSLEINFEEIEGDVNKELEQKKNYRLMNKDAIKTKKEVIRSINDKNIELCRLNIPQIMLDIPKMSSNNSSNKITDFTRFDIHQIYTMYKTLHQVTSQRYKKDYNIDDGLDYHVYRNGLYQVFMQSEDLAQRIFNTIDFNYSGFMDWEEFLRLMVIIRAKTLKDKINLFIKIADEDGNGQLSKDEILQLSKVCLSKYIKEDESGILDILCEYFTKLIFEAVEIDIEDEIPLKKIKKTIIEGNKESDLLCMFCGADI